MRSTGDGGAGWARLDGRDNALNAIRLLLACMVVIDHSWLVLTGSASPLPYLGGFAVDGFFLISGYLIAGSRSRLAIGPFLWRRALRIFPGLWGCLVVTAVALVPAAAALRGLDADAALRFRYALTNLPLGLGDGSVEGTLTQAPWPHWNLSLWTLPYEFGCYVVLGVLFSAPRFGLRSLLAVAAVCAAAILWLPPLGWQGPVVAAFARLGLTFAAGVAMWMVRDRLPASALGAAVCAAVVGFCFAVGPTVYHLAAPFPLAYLVLYAGVRLPVRLGAVHDLSYGTYLYGWPVSQTLLAAGVGRLGAGGFAAACLLGALPFAALSWFWVERPALRLRVVPRHPQASGVIPATTVHEPSSSFTFRG